VALIPLTIGPIVGQSLVSILQSREIPFLGSLTSLKINHNIHDETVSPHLSSYSRANTRGNIYKLLNHSFHYDLHKLFFSAHIVNTWNSLPYSVVGASTVNALKARLDKFWMHQTVKCDFSANPIHIKPFSLIYFKNIFVLIAVCNLAVSEQL